MRSSIFLAFFCTLLFSTCQQKNIKPDAPEYVDPVTEWYNASFAPYYHGVASGDPLPDAVIIWTRISPKRQEETEVTYEISKFPDMGVILKEGSIRTGPDRDYTVKADIRDLEAATTYYYRFHWKGNTSVIGRTRTAPGRSSVQDSISFAIVSCSNFEAGYFNAFAALSQLPDIAAVLHLGDYIYEYGVGTYGDTSLGRTHLPVHEIVSLSDYRMRYSQYRADPDFANAHQMHPFITIWDDHEIANNSYASGAQNHQPNEEGDYENRKAAARQAYYEWMPIRESETLYRNFSFGTLADLWMLDERLEARSEQSPSAQDEKYKDPDRTMLGTSQLEWWLGGMESSDAKWKIVGNQVIFSNIDYTEIFPKRPLNMDAWDGYPHEKERILYRLADKKIDNVLFVSGDTHCSWAFEVPSSVEAYKEDPVKNTLAVELGATSISSANYDEYGSLDTVLILEGLYQNPVRNPHLKYVNLRDHGFLLLNLQRDKAIAKYHFVETIKERNSTTSIGKVISIPNGTPKILQ